MVHFSDKNLFVDNLFFFFWSCIKLRDGTGNIGKELKAALLGIKKIKQIKQMCAIALEPEYCRKKIVDTVPYKENVTVRQDLSPISRGNIL